MNRMAAVVLPAFLLACVSTRTAVDTAPAMVSPQPDSIPTAEQLRQRELINSLRRTLQRLSVRGTSQCPMPVAVPDPVVTERMPVAQSRRVPWMPVVRSACVNPLCRPVKEPQ